MKLKITDFIDELSKEFGIPPKQIAVIIMEPFRFWVNMVRNKENKTLRLHNFGIIFPKKSAKFDGTGKVNRNSKSIQGDDQSNGGGGTESRKEAESMS